MLNPTTLHDEISSCTVSLQFSAFFLSLESFCRIFPNALQASISVEFKFVLKSWSSNSCAICRPTETPSFFLASQILGLFALNAQTLPFICPPLSQKCLSSELHMQWRKKSCLTYPLKQDVPHSADPLLFFLNVMDIEE